jgi:hypothetical protein
MSKTLYCAYCGSEVKDGVIREGRFYCDSECAEEQRRDRADNFARSEGYISYEDRAEHLGYTVADYHEVLHRES